MQKVIIAGSRIFKDYGLLKATLDKLFLEPVIIISGCAAGADTLGETWAKEKGYEIEKHPADWKNLDTPICVIKVSQQPATYKMPSVIL